jgi:hypothetical protein
MGDASEDAHVGVVADSECEKAHGVRQSAELFAEGRKRKFADGRFAISDVHDSASTSGIELGCSVSQDGS